MENIFVNNVVRHLSYDELDWSLDCESLMTQITKGSPPQINNNRHSIEVLNNAELFIDYKYRNLNASETNHTKILPILHHIWLTSPDEPRQIREQDIANIIKTQKMFKVSFKHDWTQIIWVNNISLLQASIKQLEGTGIEVRQFDQIGTHLSNYKIVQEQIELKHWGIASDLLRYDLVGYMGGVYADMNYVFTKVPDRECNSFDFFGVTFGSSGYLSMENFIFGAKSNHPVIATTQTEVRKNLEDPSAELQELYNNYIGDFTNRATAAPLGDSFFGAAHQEDNIDVIFPRPTLGESEAKTQEEYLICKHHTNDLFIKNLKNMSIYCPHMHKDLKEQFQKDEENCEYIVNHEICPVEKDIIGYDSKDGGTWHELN